MGTRSRIGVMHGDKCKSVYCHWDGYLSHNGAILQEHYDSARANNLVAMGDMSSLGKVIGEQHPFSPFGSKEDETLYEHAKEAGYCTFYGRDRGEKGTDFRVSQTFEEFLALAEGCGAEYYYLLKDGVWYCGDTYGSTPLSGKLVLLTEALAAEKEEA